MRSATDRGRGGHAGSRPAALRNDFTERRRRELNTLAPADRAAAQGWLDKAAARDAAPGRLPVNFAAEAMERRSPNRRK